MAKILEHTVYTVGICASLRAMCPDGLRMVLRNLVIRTACKRGEIPGFWVHRGP